MVGMETNKIKSQWKNLFNLFTTSIQTPYTILMTITPVICRSDKKLIESLKLVRSIPDMGNCNEPIFWKVVGEGKEIVPLLLNKMTDTKKLKKVYVRYFGGEYTVAECFSPVGGDYKMERWMIKQNKNQTLNPKTLRKLKLFVILYFRKAVKN